MVDQKQLLREPDNDELERLSQLDLDEVPPDKWARNLVEMIEVMSAAYRRDGLPEHKASRLASMGVLAIAEHHGGRQFYLPRGDTLLTALRDADIYRRANRGNIETLAAEHGLTVSQIYRICRLQRALHIGKVQGRLFEEKESSS